MKYGSGLSLTAPADPVAVRDQVQALDGAGFDFTTLGGHILAAPDGRYEGRPPFTYVGPFHDHFVLFAYLAGVTERIHFISSIIILPLFPTALVAKQSAELQYVSGGRFELGVGISWSEHEYEALGQNIRNRGRRLEEQVELLRRFWKEPFVQFEGRYHRVDNLGLNRPPIQVPVWIGSTAGETQLRRIARIADGWLPMGDPTEPLQQLRGYLEEEGRDLAAFQVQGRLALSADGSAAWVEEARRLQAAGVTHLNLAASPGASAAEALAQVLEARSVLADAIG